MEVLVVGYGLWVSKFHSFHSKMGICEICESGVNIDGDWVLRRFREGLL